MNRKISFRQGSEGPRHDPYAWNEVRVTDGRHVYVLRDGALGYSRLIVDDRKIGEVHEKAQVIRLRKRFLKMAKVTERKIDRAYEAYMNEDEDPMGPASRYE